MTDEAIRNAARQLFVERGYFETRVSDIADSAQVSVASVYAVGGGKSGLLRSLLQATVERAWPEMPFTDVDTSVDSSQLVSFVVTASVKADLEWGPLMRQVRAAAVTEPGVRESLDHVESAARSGLLMLARRLGELGSLREDVSEQQAADVLWMLLNHAAFRCRTDELGWSPSHTQTWLEQSLRELLLRPGA